MRRFIIIVEIENYDADDAFVAKEAVATCLEPLGKVKVTEVREERPKQLQMVDGEWRYE